MTLNKSIKYGKEDREEYRGSKRFDRSCRNHGNCKLCSDNRQINKLRLSQVDDMLREDAIDIEIANEDRYIE